MRRLNLVMQHENESDAKPLRNLIDQTDDEILLIDPETGRFLDVNAESCTKLKYEREELLALSVLDVDATVPDIFSWREYVSKLKKRGHFIREGSQRRKDGTTFPVEINCNYISYKSRDYMVAVVRDISGHKQCIEELEEAVKTAANERAKTEAIVEAVGDAITIQGTDFKILYQNRASKEIMGIHVGEYCYRAYARMEHICESCPIAAAFADGEVHTRARYVATLKGMKYFENTASVLTDCYGNVIAGIEVARDITKRKNAEDELAERTRQSLLAAEVAAALIQKRELGDLLQLCAESIVRHLGAAFARIWTLNKKEKMLELQASAGMYTHINGPHSRMPVGKYKIGMIALEKKPHLTNSVLKDPHISDHEWARREGMVAFAGHPLVVGGEVVGVMAMFSRKPLKKSTLATLESIADGLALGIDQKKKERELEIYYKKLEALVQDRTSELEAAYKNMESFSYAASHDLRAPLRKVDGLSRILLEDFSDKLGDHGKDLLARIQANIHGMSQLIADLLAFSRASTTDLRKVDINMTKLAQRVSDELRKEEAGRNIRLDIKTLPTGYGDVSMIRQVISNLLTNAMKFTRTRETAVIEVGGYTQNNENIFYVRDNGIGFDVRLADRLFGLFQRIHTSKKFEGTGVGLVIVKKIIEKHRGRVWADAKPNEGATFYFSLPLPPALS